MAVSSDRHFSAREIKLKTEQKLYGKGKVVRGILYLSYFSRDVSYLTSFERLQVSCVFKAEKSSSYYPYIK